MAILKAVDTFFIRGFLTMSIIKKVNDEEKVFANKSVIDHNQLANRDAYGCHPIGAVRGLPERLTKIKKHIDDVEEKVDKINIEKIEGEIANNKAKIAGVEENAKKIDIVENEAEGTFTFTNYGAESSKTIQSGYKPDEDTISLTADKKMTLKKVYTYPQFIGSGTKDDPISILTDPQTLVPNSDNVLQVIGVHAGVDGILLTGEYLDGKLKELNKDIGDLTNQLNKDVADIEAKDTLQDSQIYDLQTRTKGMGGYLNINNFGDFSKLTSEQIQTKLTDYALKEIGITDSTQIFNGTKVINSFDNHLWILTNTQDSEPKVFEWSDQGVEQRTSIANDDLLGLVRGSKERLEGSIDLLGHITLNGLDEELSDKASLTEENTFTGINHFNQKTLFNNNIEVSGNVNVDNGYVATIDTAKDLITKYSADEIVIENGSGESKKVYNLALPKQSGQIALQENISFQVIKLKDNIVFSSEGLATDKLYMYALAENITEPKYVTFTNNITDELNILHNKVIRLKITEPILVVFNSDKTIMLLYNGAFDINGNNADIIAQIGSSIEITFTDNKITAVKSYSGLAKINGQQYKNNIEIYAATNAGNAGQFLMSNGEGLEPVFSNVPAGAKMIILG